MTTESAWTPISSMSWGTQNLDFLKIVDALFGRAQSKGMFGTASSGLDSLDSLIEVILWLKADSLR